jgi:hypothetical protein
MSGRYPRTIKGPRWYAEQNHEFRTYSQAQWERDHPTAEKNEQSTSDSEPDSAAGVGT